MKTLYSLLNSTPLSPLRLTIIAASFLSSSCYLWSAPTTQSKSEQEHTPPDAANAPMESYQAQIPGSEVTFEMIAIPGGQFEQGSSHSDGNADEQPVVRVEVPAFWMGKHEVTWAEYKQFMKLCSIFEKFDDREIRQVTDENEIDAISAPSKLYDPSFTFQAGEEPDQPAVSMSQFAAKQYTKWLSLLTGDFYRLPTESEWEYACRAGTTTAYYFGDDPDLIDEYAWTDDNAEYETHPVGQKLPNAWGLYDMHGNAAEWVLDEYRPGWYASLPTRLCTTEETLCWPSKLYPRVLRGGSMYVLPADCRSASRRASNDEDLRSYDPNTPKSPWWFASDEAIDIGFRIVRPLETPSREEQEKYWQADVPSITSDVNRRIDQEGRGERGLVDPELPQAISSLRDSSGAKAKSP
ncbi:Serine/threonine-protein kinase pkn1 [Bythopirellula goksoeyrii]|uniref:Serine/threonine-protein kinase pkn1 n=2 Tax=Bythopirellula goksoeyrii TaxID=1400387 RepID=A0A5B9Q643_9BACT|nr:Serine/threonine-protein kinase pkn1 [Bythopirellula goksoeyrii]